MTEDGFEETITILLEKEIDNKSIPEGVGFLIMEL